MFYIKLVIHVGEFPGSNQYLSEDEVSYLKTRHSSNQRPLDLKSSTIPLNHCAPRANLRTTKFPFATNYDTVKPVLSGHSKTDKTKVLMANGS